MEIGPANFQVIDADVEAFLLATTQAGMRTAIGAPGLADANTFSQSQTLQRSGTATTQVKTRNDSFILDFGVDDTSCFEQARNGAGASSYKRLYGLGYRAETYRDVDGLPHISVSLKDYGAKGDGTTDDTAAIASALASGHKNICVPVSTSYYKITDVLTVPDGVTLFGGGEIHQATLGKNAFTVGNSVTFDGLTISCPSRVANISDSTVDNAVYAFQKKYVKVVNCKINNWLCMGVQLRDCFYCTVSDNTIKGAKWDLTNPASDTVTCDISVYSLTAGGGHIVTGNHCLSNNSHGIGFSASGYDTDSVIANNVCIGMESGAEPSVGTGVGGATYLNRRHGIIVSYGAGPSSGRVTVTGNVCRHTLVSGIYIAASIDGQKGIVVSGNVCSNNGYATASDSTLAGGISINGGTKGLTVTGNVIEDFRGIASTGAIFVNVSADSSTVISNNTINNSRSNGIIVYQTANNVSVTGNAVRGSTLVDIYCLLGSSAKNIVVENNICLRTNGNYQSIIYDSTSGQLAKINRNTITGFDTTSADSTGIYVQSNRSCRCEIVGNSVRNCKHGIRFLETVLTRDLTRHRVDHNTFEDCATGVLIFTPDGATGGGIQPVVGNRFFGCTENYGNASGWNCCYEAVVLSYGSATPRITYEDTTQPTSGQKQYAAFVVGDRVIKSNPAVGSPSYWVCTTAGTAATPSVWTASANL